MLVFGEIKVTGYTPGSYVLSWVVAADPSIDDISDYSYHVERSLSPEGPFDRITPVDGLSNIFLFEDTSIGSRKWIRWFYRIVAISNKGRPDITSSVVEVEFNAPTQIELFAAEIRRNQNILLRGAGITPGTLGVPCLFYIRKKFGTRCPCWSEVQQQVTDDAHPVCYGTGYTGGFMDPILVFVNMGRGLVEQTDLDPLMESEPSEGRAWTTNYPEMTYGDLLVTKDGVRFEIVRKARTILRDITSRQILTLSELPQKDIRYQIPLDIELLESVT